MAQTPSHIAINIANRQILSDLGLLIPRSYPVFIKKYPALASKNYIVLREAQGNMTYTPNKEFYQWQQRGKNAPSFKVDANVTGGGAGQNFTVTVATGYYADSGAYSPPAAGQYYMNDTSGQVYYVVSVNNVTANAHTVVLRPVLASVTGAVVAATDTLVFKPTIVGERSGSTSNIDQLDERVNNYCATIKTTKKFTDWNLFERIDIPNDPSGFDHYRPRQMYNEYDMFLMQQEELLMFGIPFDNVTDIVNQHTGLVPNVIANGSKDITSTTVNQAYFDNIVSMVDAEGYSSEYDWLLNIQLRIKVENFMQNNNTAGSLVYLNQEAFKGMGAELNQNFKAYDFKGIKLNFKTYDYFSSANIYGAPINTGVYNNAGLMIPRGDGVDPGNGTNVPRFQVRWQGQSEQDTPIRVRATGGLAPVPTNDVEELIISHVATKGLQAFGLNGYIWMKLAS